MEEQLIDSLKKTADEGHNTLCRLAGDISKRNVRKSKDTIEAAYEHLKKVNNMFRTYGYPIKHEFIMLPLKEDIYFLDALLSYLEKRDNESIRHLRFWKCEPYKSIADEALSFSNIRS